MQEVQRKKRVWWWVITVILILVLMMEAVCEETKRIYTPTPDTCRHCDVLFLHSQLGITTFPELCLFCSFCLFSLKRLLANPSFSFHLSSPLSHSSPSQVNPCCFILLAWSNFSFFCFPFSFYFILFIYPTSPHPSSRAHAHIHFISPFRALVMLKKACPQCKPWTLTCQFMDSKPYMPSPRPFIFLLVSFCAPHSTGRPWDGRFSLAVCFPSFGWDRPWNMLLAGSVEGKRGGRERGGEGGRKGNRVWEEGDRTGGGVVCSS